MCQTTVTKLSNTKTYSPPKLAVSYERDDIFAEKSIVRLEDVWTKFEYNMLTGAVNVIEFSVLLFSLFTALVSITNVQRNPLSVKHFVENAPNSTFLSDSDRPPTSAIDRPASRRLVTAENHAPPVVAENQPPEVNNVVAPPSAAPFSLRTSSRSGTASSTVPRHQLTSASVVPSTGQMRPTTQQGFIAQRPQSRLATAGMGRQVADKTYFMQVIFVNLLHKLFNRCNLKGLLNTQLNMLDTEIDSLSDELSRAEREQQNLLVYEQRAEEQANEIKKLQNELADYNLIIDRQNTSANDVRDLEFEVLEEQKRTAELGSTVEELFRERRDAEEQCRELEQKYNEIKRQNSDFLNNLDPDIKSNYEEAKAEAEQLRHELDERQAELTQLTKQKEDLDFQMASNPLKQQAMYLQEQITELEARKATIFEEMNNNDSPEVQRQKLIEQINVNNTEISHIQQEVNDLNEQVSLAQEELREFEQEFEIIAGEKNERYRDLRIKERQLDDFLSTFDVTKMETEKNLSDCQVEILKLLRQISINCQRDEINVTELDESMIGNAIRTNASAPELQELHVRLQEEKIGLDETESRLNAELESIKREQDQRRNEAKSLVDFEQLKERTSDETRDLVNKASELDIKVAAKESECAQLSGQLSSMIQRLSQSPTLSKIARTTSKT
ncbi:Intraflagellar transport protein 74-like protein [Aphelenchoides bicaudatus]|nr:Intraflagellar transport protein 74-like protein [Aphelenchoides bicaudatus]